MRTKKKCQLCLGGGWLEDEYGYCPCPCGIKPKAQVVGMGAESMNEVYIVECFDERGGEKGGPLSGWIGGSAFIANQVAYADKKMAVQAYRGAKEGGLAASIRRLVLMGDFPKVTAKKR